MRQEGRRVLRNGLQIPGGMAEAPPRAKRDTGWIRRYARALRSLRHPTFEQVHQMVGEGEAPSTTWRRLESLVDAGVVMKTSAVIGFGRRGVRVGYELREDRHCHLICRRCGWMADGPALARLGLLQDLYAQLRAKAAQKEVLAVDLRIELEVICSKCQNSDEQRLAIESEGVTKQLAQDLRFTEVPPRYFWERPRAAGLRKQALEVIDGMPRVDDSGTMDREQQPWQAYWAVHKDCKHCRHFGVDLPG